MTMKKLLLPALAAVVALGSCSKTTESQPDRSDYLGIGGLTTVDLATKAELPAGTLGAGSIGVFAFRGTDYSDNNVQYSYGTPKWTAATPIPLTDVGAKVYAYYPYQATVQGTAAAPTLTFADNNIADPVDYLYSGIVQKTDNTGDMEFTKTNYTVNPLKMYHALAKIVFVKAQDATYPGAGVISSITLKNKAGQSVLVAGGTLDIKTGVITPNSTTTAYTFLTGNTNSFKTGAVSASKMVVPASIAAAGNAVAEIVMDGNTYNLDLPAGTWVKGTINTYTLTVSTSGLEIQSVEVQDWMTGLNVNLPIE